MNHIHADNPILEYNHIADGIFVGNNQCCIMGLSEVLKREHIVADISLEENRLDVPFGVDIYLWIPVVDEQAPTFDQLSFGAESIERLVLQGKKIYIHCKNGHGRAPTFVAAYLIRKGRTPEDAVNFIASKRPSIHLHKEQEEILKTYYERLSRHKDT